jgi:hypothetical protein
MESFLAMITRKTGTRARSLILSYLSVVSIIPAEDTLIDIIAYCCNGFQ